MFIEGKVEGPLTAFVPHSAPNEPEVEGLPSVGTVTEIVGGVDVVSFYGPPSVGLKLLPGIATKSPAEVWLNPGAESRELIAAATDLGLKCVQTCSIIAVGFSTDGLSKRGRFCLILFRMPESPSPDLPGPEPLPPPLPTRLPPPQLSNLRPRALWQQSMDAHDDLDEGETRQVRGIGGWLLLFTLGRVLAILFWAAALYKDLSIFTKPGVWQALTTPGSSAYQPFWFKLIIYETTGNTLMLLGSILLVCLLFTQRKIFRSLMVSYLIVTPIFLWGDYWLAQPVQKLNPGALDQAWQGCLQNTLVALIWVPYLLVSERVRGTFYK